MLSKILRKYTKENYLVLCVLFLTIIVLLPLLNSGYVGDDAINSITKGFLNEQNRSAAALTAEITSNWIHIGRFYPLAGWTYFLFSIVTSLVVYKALILAFVLANILAFGYLIKLLTDSKAMSIAAMVPLPILFQFRIYHDPILSFTFLLQIVFMYTLLSLIFLVWFLKSGKKTFYVLSLSVYLASLLTYEITYLFFIFHFIVIFYSASKSSFKQKAVKSAVKALPFFLISLLIIAITIGIRIYFKVPITGDNVGAYVPSANAVTFAKTLIKQTSAAFPLSYYFADPMKIFTGMADSIRERFLFSSLIFASFIFLVIVQIRMLSAEISKNSYRSKTSLLIVLGSCFVVIPGMLTSLSTRYQGQVSWGVGYLPVYISYFGLSMIFTAILSLFYSKIKNKSIKIISIWLLSILIAVPAVINYFSNYIVVQNLNAFWLYPRSIIEKSLKNGLFNKVTNNSNLVSESNNPWDQKAFYLMHSGKRLGYYGVKGAYSIKNLSSYSSNNIDTKKLNTFLFDDRKTFYIRYGANPDTGGYAILANVKRMQASDIGLKDTFSNQIYFYIRNPNFPAWPIYQIKSRWLDNKSNLRPAKDFKVKLLKRRDDWSIYALELKDELIDSQTLIIAPK